MARELLRLPTPCDPWCWYAAGLASWPFAAVAAPELSESRPNSMRAMTVPALSTGFLPGQGGRHHAWQAVRWGPSHGPASCGVNRMPTYAFSNRHPQASNHSARRRDQPLAARRGASSSPARHGRQRVSLRPAFLLLDHRATAMLVRHPPVAAIRGAVLLLEICSSSSVQPRQLDPTKRFRRTTKAEERQSRKSRHRLQARHRDAELHGARGRARDACDGPATGDARGGACE